jgi:DNA-binding response OmpR family regulator
MQLIPHLLLRSESTASRAAMLLREAGYLVTKVTDDEMALQLAASLQVDGVVIDLPVLAAIGAVRKLYDTPAPPPVLVISRSPEVIRRSTGAAVLRSHDMETDLISATDLLLAQHERQAI